MNLFIIENQHLIAEKRQKKRKIMRIKKINIKTTEQIKNNYLL